MIHAVDVACKACRSGNVTCHTLRAEARMAPDRVTLFAKGIVRYASKGNNDVGHRAFVPSSDEIPYLTTLHPLFVLSCVATRHFTVALRQVPIINIDASLSDLIYLDSLKYHYICGIALAALR
ncbi:hypothetical protein AX14_012530 [Amanita brunnescens Koide BX004]|nr:hypothetical protein AX14_012530 [Amanita brunnescens Koide BX004]